MSVMERAALAGLKVHGPYAVRLPREAAISWGTATGKDMALRDLRIPDQRHPEKAHRPDQAQPKKPAWIRVKAPTSDGYKRTRDMVRFLRTALTGDGTARLVMAGEGPAIHFVGTHAGSAAPRSFKKVRRWFMAALYYAP